MKTFHRFFKQPEPTILGVWIFFPQRTGTANSLILKCSKNCATLVWTLNEEDGKGNNDQREASGGSNLPTSAVVQIDNEVGHLWMQRLCWSWKSTSVTIYLLGWYLVLNVSHVGRQICASIIFACHCHVLIKNQMNENGKDKKKRLILPQKKKHVNKYEEMKGKTYQ